MSYIDGKFSKDIGEKNIIKETIKVSNNAMSNVSNFCVGATIETEDGKLFTGCNFELNSLLYTLCAERSAIDKAITVGERNFKRIYIYGHKRGEDAYHFISPCGICLQVMNEICNEDFEIISIKSENETQKHTLKEYLPMGFATKRK